MLSRVADSLYWMSRYLERAEHTARVLDVTLRQMLDQTPTRQLAQTLEGVAHRACGDRRRLTAGDNSYRITEALTFDLAQQWLDQWTASRRRATMRGRCASRSVRRCGSNSTGCS